MRYLSHTPEDLRAMLDTIGVKKVEDLFSTIPAEVRMDGPIDIKPRTEWELTAELGAMAEANCDSVAFLGAGCYPHHIPAHIPYLSSRSEFLTSYTPYQPEVSQGTLQAIFEFQTMTANLLGMEVANASMYDGANALAEAAIMAIHVKKKPKVAYSRLNHPHYIQAMKTYFRPAGFEAVEVPVLPDGRTDFSKIPDGVSALVVQSPNFAGVIEDLEAAAKAAHDKGILLIASFSEAMAWGLLKNPGSCGADIVSGEGSSFGIPLSAGGPGVGMLACSMKNVRSVPGRLVGETTDKNGNRCFVLTLAAREQHIRREKATSNICTAQALLAIVAGAYAMYHGPEGLRAIAERLHTNAARVATALQKAGYGIAHKNFFDTVVVEAPGAADELVAKALDADVNIRRFDANRVGISVGESHDDAVLGRLVKALGGELPAEADPAFSIPDALLRTDDYMQHPIFHKYRSETEMMRYLRRLSDKDLALDRTMIPLGSCTMKLNAASEMLPLSRPEFQNIHPYAPVDQAAGYIEMIENLSAALIEITGLKGVTLQPNSGAAGEYTGLRIIRSYLESIGQGHRNVVLLPASAHGTNPASAIQCGFTTVTVRCDEKGNVDLADFRAKAEENRDNLAASMITYPSTHGIFETDIKEMCDIVHACGGQLYMDGANMNAQVGLTNPGTIGADVCHLNLHKTFASPHGGGGPGVGPVCVAEHLLPFLPSHPVAFGNSLNTVAAAPYGSAGILPITYGYIRMMGADGLTEATKVAILNANYLAAKLEKDYGIVYNGARGRVGHELILECRTIKEQSGIDESDIAKRLMDFGYHAPTLSFPVHGTLMIEPTESESKHELDRFVEVMQCIRKEIDEVEKGTADKEDNVLKNAPHPEYEVTADAWSHPYPRTKAAFPLEWLHDGKFWVNVARVNNAYGDRNLVPTLCGCCQC